MNDTKVRHFVELSPAALARAREIISRFQKTHKNCLILRARDVAEKSTVVSANCAQIHCAKRSTE